MKAWRKMTMRCIQGFVRKVSNEVYWEVLLNDRPWTQSWMKKGCVGR